MSAEIKDLRLLVALAQYRHFGRAAEACHISQPAFSERIQRLEQTLGVPIVLRGHRFAGFTEAGERILSRARRVLADADGLMQDVALARGALSGLLRIGVVPSVVPAAAQLAASMAVAHPQVQVQVRNASSTDILRALDDFEIDVGFTYLEAGVPRGLKALPLYAERYFLVAERDLVPAVGAFIPWRDVAALPLCLLTAEMQNRRIVDGAFAAAGVHPVPRIETNAFGTIIGAVRAGGVAGVLPGLFADAVRGISGLVIVPIREPDTSYGIGLIAAEREPDLPVVEALWSLAPTLIGNTD